MRGLSLMWWVCGAAAAPALAQVELPEGFELVDFDVSDYFTNAPRLNNCGQIAYGKRLGDSWSQAEIFIYENGKITRITNNQDRDVFPDINDAGTIVWLRGDGSNGSTKVILYENGSESVLDDNPIGVDPPAINGLGHVSWSRDVNRGCPISAQIWCWDGNVKTQISPSEPFADRDSDINDAGWITWMHTDFCVDPWAGDIRLYVNGDINPLPAFGTQVQGPRINNHNQIVWQDAGDIELWDDGETVILAARGGGRLFAVPAIGDSGGVFYAGWEDARQTWNAWLCQLGTPNRYYRLSDDDNSASRGSVNAWGEVAWVYYRNPPLDDWHGGIRYMRRIRTGDADFDGSIDLKDYARLAERIGGPVPTDGLCACRFLDIDYDGDLDLRDVARFQNAYMGP